MSADADRCRHAIFAEGNAAALAYQSLACPDGFDMQKSKSFDALVSNAENAKDATHPLFNIEDFYFNENKTGILDKKMRGFMNDVSTRVAPLLESGMLKRFPANNMVDIIMSGSKGSMVNLGQISLALGQQELEGKRVPFMMSGKTLPCFRKLEMCPSAGGFIFERFLTGINPATFFFHSMAGREGLIDTAIKTANSGYLQRCLAKHLESVYVRNDRKVMSGDRIVQFKFGDDGLDITKCSYLKNFDFYMQNFDHFKKSSRIEDELDTPATSNNSYGYDADLIPEDYAESIKKLPVHLANFMYNRFINSLTNPGHAVGIIAAQSIGEPSTTDDS
ncbi:uncharacterized protein VICG_00827 [Vittaforma corneae ATCC 50505]|uniref:DNA-directed RNA polymerase n=1 Tax=Vittaforma corneae (strain ATCC 50505) TaxID=993615 RepID=L2GNK0_VITCO|nr:uncharacterized protein VICG_00827 [Vittaforma corneae ATCC 50505]ELA42184.1 hypothetical protein VICG_00827 [Vittaforma corneae ATCC 50505]